MKQDKLTYEQAQIAQQQKYDSKYKKKKKDCGCGSGKKKKTY